MSQVEERRSAAVAVTDEILLKTIDLIGSNPRRAGGAGHAVSRVEELSRPSRVARAVTRVEPRFYTVKQVVDLFDGQISDMSIYRAIKAGLFPAVRIGSRYFVPRKALDEMHDAAMASGALVDAADWAPEEVMA